MVMSQYKIKIFNGSKMILPQRNSDVTFSSGVFLWLKVSSFGDRNTQATKFLLWLLTIVKRVLIESPSSGGNVRNVTTPDTTDQTDQGDPNKGRQF